MCQWDSNVQPPTSGIWVNIHFSLRYQTCAYALQCSSGSPLFSVSAIMTLIDLYILIVKGSLRWLHKGESLLNILTSHNGHCNCPQESNRERGGIWNASLAELLISSSITIFQSKGPMRMGGYWSLLLFVTFSDISCFGFLCISWLFNLPLQLNLESLSFLLALITQTPFNIICIYQWQQPQWIAWIRAT